MLSPVSVLRNDRTVRKSHLVLLDVQRDLPGNLVARLVETRIGPAGPNLFELGVNVPLAAIFHLENALLVFAADLTLEGDVERGLAGTNVVTEVEARHNRAAR